MLPRRHGTEVRLVRRAPAEEVPVTVLGHPSGACQVRVPGSPRAIRLASRINVEDDLGNLPPVGSSGFRIEQTEVGDEVLLVVPREDSVGGRHIGDGRVERWRSHASVHPTCAQLAPILFTLN